MKCPKCNKEAPWVSNDVVYGRRYGKSYMCYWCKDCDTYVGCHNNTKKPLGTMADKETREARKNVHAFIDPLWRSRKYSRKKIYQQLNDAFGEVIHIGESSVEKCDEILKTAKLLFVSNK